MEAARQEKAKWKLSARKKRNGSCPPEERGMGGDAAEILKKNEAPEHRIRSCFYQWVTVSRPLSSITVRLLRLRHKYSIPSSSSHSRVPTTSIQSFSSGRSPSQ